MKLEVVLSMILFAVGIIVSLSVLLRAVLSG